MRHRSRVWILPQIKSLVCKWRKIERSWYFIRVSNRVLLALGDFSVFILVFKYLLSLKPFFLSETMNSTWSMLFFPFRGLMDNLTLIVYMEDVKYSQERNGQLLNGWGKELYPKFLIHFFFFFLFFFVLSILYLDRKKKGVTWLL